MASFERELLDGLKRLGKHAPAAATSTAIDVVRALCAGFPVIDSDKLAATVAGLGDDVRAKYVAAMALGPAEVLRLVEDAVEAVATRPQDFSNMLVPAPSKRARDGSGAPSASARPLRASVADVASHDIVRFTVYGALKSSLGYGGGARVPLPGLAETLVKLVRPALARPRAHCRER